MLSTKTGKIDMKTCIYNASGVGCRSHEELLKLNQLKTAGAVLSKSCTVYPRDGNCEPRYWDNGSSLSINSSGLPNYGYHYYINKDLTNILNKPYIVSISGTSFVDNLTIIDYANTSDANIAGIELNLSCPNVIGKSQIGYDFETMDKLLSKTRSIIPPICNINFGVKLPPYFDFAHFEAVSNILNKYNIDTITCINSLGNGLVVDPISEKSVIKPKGGFGGIGGSVVKPIALANVRKFSELANADVIGCGGITNGWDAFEHILCGAKAVQLGTQFYMEDIEAFNRITKELKEIMKSKNYKSIYDFCGKLQTL